MAETYVVPCGKNGFKIKVGDEFIPIANLEEFALTVDGTTQEWYPYELDGKRRVLKTANAYSLSCSCKRTFGDAAQEEIYKTTFLTGKACTKEFQVNWADGELLNFNGAINVGSLGGATVDIMTLEFEVLVDGDIEVTPASAE